jgi:hypothetical protein
MYNISLFINCNNESPLYNKYILFKKFKKKEKYWHSLSTEFFWKAPSGICRRLVIKAIVKGLWEVGWVGDEWGVSEDVNRNWAFVKPVFHIRCLSSIKSEEQILELKKKNLCTVLGCSEGRKPGLCLVTADIL